MAVRRGFGRCGETAAEPDQPGGQDENGKQQGTTHRGTQDETAQCLTFAGRADAQIKAHGYRIELGEIEAALYSLKYLSDGAVTAVESGENDEDRIICGAIVLRPGEDIAPSLVLRDLRQLIPRYMIPARWLRLDEMPKNPNGKIDRLKLKEMFQNS